MMPRLVWTERIHDLAQSFHFSCPFWTVKSHTVCGADLFPTRRTGVGFAVSSLQHSWYVLPWLPSYSLRTPQCPKKPLALCPFRQTASTDAIDCSHLHQVDYRLVMDDRWKWDAMSAEKFVEMISSDGFLGDRLIKTQHDTEVIGHHQLRAARLRFTGPDMQRVDRRGHSHTTNEHLLRKGQWRLEVRWPAAECAVKRSRLRQDLQGHPSSMMCQIQRLKRQETAMVFPSLPQFMKRRSEASEQIKLEALAWDMRCFIYD